MIRRCLIKRNFVLRRGEGGPYHSTYVVRMIPESPVFQCDDQPDHKIKQCVYE